MRRKSKGLRAFASFLTWLFKRRLGFGVAILFLGLLFSFGPGRVSFPTEDGGRQVRASEGGEFKVGRYPRKVGNEEELRVLAEAAFVVDFESGVPLYSKNADKKLYPASLTKLMTALVALDYYTPEQILTVKRLSPVAYESEMGLAVGEELTLKTLIYGLLVPSGNDAAYTIADNYPGGIENFLYAMNKKAENLAMKNTHFDNPSGFDGLRHHTTARDLAILTQVALRSDLVNDVVATYGITLGDIEGRKSYSVKNVNQFLGYLYGADGVKTGYTDLAGQCLIASVSRDGHRVISVVLKSSDRFFDSGRLIEWVYRNFQWTAPENLL